MQRAGLLVFVAALAAPPASAHVSLENKQAAVGSYYKAVFTVPHGCAGSSTTKVRVQIPEGVVGIKPMPKAGWQLETVKGKYASTYEFHGAKISEGVKEVVLAVSGIVPCQLDLIVAIEMVDGTHMTAVGAHHFHMFLDLSRCEHRHSPLFGVVTEKRSAARMVQPTISVSANQ